MADEQIINEMDDDGDEGERVAFVVHPISQEQKRHVLGRMGYDRILDARFAPEGVKVIRFKAEGEDAAKAPAKKAPAKAPPKKTEE